MLIGNVLEKTSAEFAWQLCADKLADRVRDIWLVNTKLGARKWEESFSEDPNALPGLRKEGFAGLVGLDYIFKWWGGSREADATAGEIDVIWKVLRDEEADSVSCYRSWIKVGENDFTLGLFSEEREKREANRQTYRDAFARWKELFFRL